MLHGCGALFVCRCEAQHRWCCHCNGTMFSLKELALLNECAERMGTTRANVVARGIEKVYRELEEAE